jgi:hypothetical protein
MRFRRILFRGIELRTQYQHSGKTKVHRLRNLSGNESSLLLHERIEEAKGGTAQIGSKNEDRGSVAWIVADLMGRIQAVPASFGRAFLTAPLDDVDCPDKTATHIVSQWGADNDLRERSRPGKAFTRENLPSVHKKR